MTTTDEQMLDTVDAAPSVRFDDLGLSDAVMKAVRDMRYETPTPVQAAAIPEVLSGRDLLAAAQTGTGKTAAFLLPVMSRLDHVQRRGRDRKWMRGRGPHMLVITPTRELAQQIDDVCTTIARRTKHVAVTVVGGVGYNPQRSALKRGCDILVATPGRLCDLIEQGAANLSEVEVLVLDEADRMLDMGFLPQVRAIVEKTPEDRQTLLFSATLDEKEVGAITDLVHDPARVEIAPATATADTIDQFVLPVSTDAKNGMLTQLLKKEGPEHVIVFVRTKRRADVCCKRLERAGISCAPIHGDRSQAQRERALAAFRKGKIDVLVATDVLARGIDITDVRYVVNFDVPEEPTDYIHRIGRTGRAGELGWALTFVTDQDIDEFYDIEALMGKTADIYDAGDLPVGEHPPAIDPDRVPEKRSKKRTRRGKSTSKKKSSGQRGGARGSRGLRDGEGASAPRPARPKRAGRARVRTEDAEAADRASAATSPASSTAPATSGSDHANWSRHDRRAAAFGDHRDGGSDGRRRSGDGYVLNGHSVNRGRGKGGRNREDAEGERGFSDRRSGGKRGERRGDWQRDNRGERSGENRSENRGRNRGEGRREAAHDWRNSDLVEDRRGRGTRSGRAGGRDRRGAQGRPQNRGNHTRRPGDRGGRRS